MPNNPMLLESGVSFFFAMQTAGSITEDALLAGISAAPGAEGRQAAEALLALARRISAEIAFRQTGASVQWLDPQGSSARINLYVLSSKGTFYVWWLRCWEGIGADPATAPGSLERLESILGRQAAYRPAEDRDAVPLGIAAQHLNDMINLSGSRTATDAGVRPSHTCVRLTAGCRGWGPSAATADRDLGG